MSAEGLCSKCRDKWGPYIVVMNASTPAVPVEKPADPSPSGWLTMVQAAAKCQCSVYWFSRNWRNWGLHPSKLGRLLFSESEIENLLREKRLNRRGRPRKVRGPVA